MESEKTYHEIWSEVFIMTFDNLDEFPSLASLIIQQPSDIEKLFEQEILLFSTWITGRNYVYLKSEREYIQKILNSIPTGLLDYYTKAGNIQISYRILGLIIRANLEALSTQTINRYLNTGTKEMGKSQKLF